MLRRAGIERKHPEPELIAPQPPPDLYCNRGTVGVPPNMRGHQPMTTNGYADPAGKHLLDTYPNAYGAHGFVYVEWCGSIIATGGDGAITVGIYDNEDALNDGHASAYREWDTITPQTIAEAIDMIERHTNA